MNGENKSFDRLVMKKLALIAALVFMSIFSLAAVVVVSIKSSKDEAVLIDYFGRQRMLTQMIAKDANRKYALLSMKENGPFVQTDEVINEKVSMINASLSDAYEEFESRLLSLHTHKLQNGDDAIDFNTSSYRLRSVSDELDEAWAPFSGAMQTLIKAEKADEDTAKALIYINMNNTGLLEQCDELMREMIGVQKANANKYMLAAIILFAASLISLLISIMQLRKYIVLPLGRLYQGIGSMGILREERMDIPTQNDIEPIVQELKDSFHKLHNLIELIANINGGTSFDEVLKYIYDSFSQFIPYSHIGIALLQDDGKTLEASYGISNPSLNGLSRKLAGIRTNIDKTSLKGVILNGTPRIINDLEDYTKNSGAIYNKILVQSGIKASITLPLKTNNRLLGIIFFSSDKKNIYTEEHIEFLETLANSIAVSFSSTIFIEELLYSSILALAKMAESRDEDTGVHLDRIKIYSKAIAEFLFEDNVYADIIDVKFIKDIERFSPMHDIGKVGIKDVILLKPAKLSKEEFEEMKRHTVYGAEILKAAERNMEKRNKTLFKTGIEIAECHHEKWNGTGYPYGMAGEEIPISARIVAVADVLDALTSERPYKKAFSFEKAIDIIEQESGEHFDPDIVDCLIRHRDDIFRIYERFCAKK
ncbi:MAG: HD domain-containing protein [Clostridia bacterium]|nr:HD domain-containing protein [Clostridia bacterium]